MDKFKALPVSFAGFHDREGQQYCQQCFLTLFASRCQGCSQPILENYISALNSLWHPQCFVCRVSVSLWVWRPCQWRSLLHSANSCMFWALVLQLFVLVDFFLTLKESAVFRNLKVPCGVFLSTSKSVESVPASLFFCKADCLTIWNLHCLHPCLLAICLCHYMVMWYADCQLYMPMRTWGFL